MEIHQSLGIFVTKVAPIFSESSNLAKKAHTLPALGRFRTKSALVCQRASRFLKRSARICRRTSSIEWTELLRDKSVSIVDQVDAYHWAFAIRIRLLSDAYLYVDVQICCQFHFGKIIFYGLPFAMRSLTPNALFPLFTL